MTRFGAEGHRTERGNGGASFTRYFSASDGSLMAWKEAPDYDYMLKLHAGVLVLLATVLFFGLYLGGALRAAPEVASEDQDNVSLINRTKAQPVPGVGDPSENGEAAGAVSSTTETTERYIAQKGMLLRYTVTDLSLLFGRTELSLG